MSQRRLWPGVAVTGILLAATVGTAPGAPAATTTAPGAPGATSYFDLGRKDCVGTAHGGSKVWYTVADGVLSDVYEPTIDNTDVHSLDFAVTDGATFTDIQTRDLTYTVKSDSTGMVCTVTATSSRHGYRLVARYSTDPARDSVLIHLRLVRTRSGVGTLRVFAHLDAHVNGNGGGGQGDAGGDDATVTAAGVPVIGDSGTVSTAVNRDYAVPTYLALDATTLGAASVGYAGTQSDGLLRLDSTHRLSPRYTAAPDGHVVATLNVTPRSGGANDLALGFGRTASAATGVASASLSDVPGALQAYLGGWKDYDAGLVDPFAGKSGIDPAQRHAYTLSANVLKASEDKTFRGALVASLASPWGQAVPANSSSNGRPVYFGSYREVFARDLYEAATGLLADGDRATAQAAARFLFLRQQLPDGSMPRNSLLNGKSAPDTGGVQLDETAYPILLAYLAGLAPDATLYTQHVVPAADFLVAHGPAYGVERWEEQTGYSPSTIAAEIAGLTAAAAIAHRQGDTAHQRLYQAVADAFQRQVKKWTVTHNGPLSAEPYFIRLSKTGDPDAAISYNLGNGGSTLDQRRVVDAGFLELVRLGELRGNDPDVVASLPVVDSTISAATATGTGFHRYNGDGYGDCGLGVGCPEGQPWPTAGIGTGHLWPVLSGERAEYDIRRGLLSPAGNRLQEMLDSASGVGLVPEQVWDLPDLAAAPYGSDPTTSSIGFRDGEPAGSAAPLTWAQAQLVRLIVDLQAGRVTDMPAITAARYIDGLPPGQTTIDLHVDTSNVEQTGIVAVSGHAAPGAEVVVSAIDTDVPHSAVTSLTADGAGQYAGTVAVGLGNNVITAAATTHAGRDTSITQQTVDAGLVGATPVFSVSDPDGDDNGPGTYQYPTASDFVAGSFDLERFEVLEAGDTIYLRATLRTLVATFNNDFGAQLLDIYVRQPSGTVSTAAAFPQRNYTVADGWTQRLEVQGFAAPVWVDAAGNPAGTVTGVTVSVARGTVTIALPAAQFGTPTSGWTFTVALTGQDGFSSDQARTFAATPQPYQFGVCAAGDTAAFCGNDPNAVAKVLDTIPPTGVSQSSEWLATGPARLLGVTLP